MWQNIKKILLKNLWIVWLVVFLIILIIFAFRKIHSNDFWWILALGQHFWETKEIINYDVFSHTFANGFFWNHSRLFDIIIYWLYDHGKYWSLNIFRFLLLGLSYIFIYKTIALKKHHKIITILLLTLTLFPLGNRLLFRPELISLFFTTTFLYLLFNDKYHSSKLIWLLPILQMIWANSHAGYIYGLVIIGIFFISELIRSLIRHKNNTLLIYKDKRLIRLFLVGILSLAAIFLNPYGWQIIPLTYRLTLPQEALNGIAEWKAYSWKNLFNLTNPLAILVVFSIIIVVYKNLKQKYISGWLKKIKYFAWEEIFLLVLYLYSTLKHGRFGFLLSLIAAIIIAKNIYGLLRKKWIDHKFWPHLLMFITIIILISDHYDRQWGLGPETDRYPQAAVDFIKEQQIPGKMFNKYGAGGYLTFNLFPYKQVAIDGRTPNLYTNDFFWRYQNINNDNIRKKIVEEYDINFWLWSRDSKLQDGMWLDPEWQLIYFDNLSTVHIKNTEKNQDIIDDLAYHFINSQADEKTIIAMCSEENLTNNPELKQDIIQELEKGLEINSKNWLHLQQLATVYQRCHFDEQDLPKIENYLLQAHEINPNDQLLNYKLGFTYLQLNDNEKAYSYFKKAGSSRLTLTGLGTTQYNLGQYKKALKTLLKARDKSGKMDEKYHQTLGRVYYQLDQNKSAIEFFHRYQDMTQDFSAEIYTDLALAYKDDEQIDQAKNYLQLALEQDPEYGLALNLKKELD